MVKRTQYVKGKIPFFFSIFPSWLVPPIWIYWLWQGASRKAQHWLNVSSGMWLAPRCCLHNPILLYQCSAVQCSRPSKCSNFYTIMISGKKRIYAKKSVNFVILKFQPNAVISELCTKIQFFLNQISYKYLLNTLPKLLNTPFALQ